MNKEILSYSFKLPVQQNASTVDDFVSSILDEFADELDNIVMECYGTPEADAVIDRIRNIK